MRRTYLDDQWNFLESADLATLNVGRGTVEVLDPTTKKVVPHKLRQSHLDLIKFAYERGLKQQALY